MGPSLQVNSACSSALSAVAQAATALLTQQADMAVGGASALSFPSQGYLYEEGLVFSIDGRVRPFDAKAQGTVFGDAVGAVVLKRADDAAPRRRFRVRSDPRARRHQRRRAQGGYAAPGGGQRAAVVSALRMAGVSASSISYVECHATGTLVGDGIELRALAEAYAAEGAGAATAPYCSIGSVKGNIGHANAAAGITGLIKTGHVPRQAHASPDGALRQPQRQGRARRHAVLRPRGAAPRTGRARAAQAARRGAAASPLRHRRHQRAHGARGGAAAARRRPTTRRSRVAARRARRARGQVAAKSSSARRRAEALAARADGAAAALARVAHTLHTGREAFAHRLAVVAGSPAQAAARLREAASALANSGGGGGGSKAAPRVLLIFPGQGSQCPRMGEGQAKASPFRAHVDRMCEALLPLLGFDLREWIYPSAALEKAEAYRAAFDAPTVAQPAIFVTELALGCTLVDLGVDVAAVGGHSIGEFVAATLAGVFDEADALALIAARAAVGGGAEGAMLAVAATRPRGRRGRRRRARRVAAVRNTAGRQVLAGEPADVAAAAAALKAEGVKCRALPLNRASPHADDGRRRRRPRRAARGDHAQAAVGAALCNGTGGWMEAATATDARLLGGACRTTGGPTTWRCWRRRRRRSPSRSARATRSRRCSPSAGGGRGP